MLEDSVNLTQSELSDIRKAARPLIACFEKPDECLRPLPAYTATVMGRCYIVFASFWLALQGAYLYSAALMPAAWWFVAFMCASAVTFVFAARLWRNLTGASAAMQFASILLIGISLAQGGQLGVFSARYLWLVPAITLLPAFVLAVRCNLAIFACVGYAVALAMPILAGVPESRPLLFFGYYFLLCLPLPLLALVRRWTYLNLGVFIWFFGTGSYYLLNMRSVDDFYFAQLFFILFLAWYVLTVWARITRYAFSLQNFFEFFFSVGLAIGSVICQLLVALHQGGVLFSAAALGMSLLAVSILGRLFWGENGVSLSRVYFFIAAALLDGAIALLWPGAIALGVYCLQAALLFWLGSAAGLMRVKAGGFIILMLAPVYLFAAAQDVLAGSMLLASTALFFAYMQDRELKRLTRRSGRKPWSSRLEFFLVAYGFAWCFGGLAVFTFSGMPSPGLIYFALSSACAYLFFALGKFFRLRSLRTAIFIPMLIAVPAALLPFVHQTCIEWPNFDHMVSYNYLTEFGALAWFSYFITVWTALYNNWGGLISNRNHARFLALVTLELVLVLTSSSRAFALEAGVSPSLLSVLAVLPSLACIFVLARVMKLKPLERSYRKPILLAVPWLLFAALGLWYVSSLSSPGSAAPGGKYIPLLNPMETVQLMCILLFAYWQRRLRKSTVSMPHLSRGVTFWIYGVSSFLWIHGVMFRVVQYFSQAAVQEVFGFVELRIIFACIWAGYGILAWIGGGLFASTFSWLTGFILLAAGAGALIYLAIGLWGQFVAAVMGSVAIITLILLVWLSPLPFTSRGRKMAERI